MNNRDLIPLTCTGHTQAVVDLHFSPMTYDRKYYLISASKGNNNNNNNNKKKGGGQKQPSTQRKK